MVPESYHAFYSGCVSVAGALIGLLFVAISIAPHKLAGEDLPSIGFQIRAGTAFAALLNALGISLVALLPRDDLGLAAVVLAISGISSVLGLAIAGLRQPEAKGRALRWALVRFGSLIVLFAAQLVDGFAMSASLRNTGPIAIEALLVMLSFLIGIDRAWELLGGTNDGLLAVFAEGIRQRRTGGS